MMHRDGPRPNLFIIGAAKSGTTSLHYYLDAHPEVCMSSVKEPGYFVPEITAFPKDEAWYRGLFAGADGAKVIGESSTHYSKLPIYQGVPERIARFNPDARFIYLMRDPIDRAISQYWHHVKQRAEHRPILTAMKREVRYTAFSDYKMQLTPYFDLFGRDRVLLLTFEQLAADPARVMDRVLRWLGVDPTAGPTEFEVRNARPEALLKPKGRGLMTRFQHSRFWATVAPYVPKRWREAATRALALEPVRPAAEPIDEVVEFLRPGQLEKVQELSAFLGREFPEWTTVHGGTLPSLAAATA
ncbi:MAG TPA: sulfotransferase [Longimicrobiales bacterium]